MKIVHRVPVLAIGLVVIISLSYNIRKSKTINTEITTLKSKDPDPFHNYCFRDEQKDAMNNLLTAREIVDILSAKLGISNKTTREIYEAVERRTISIDGNDLYNIKIILGYHGYGAPFQYWFNFSGCEYSNCVAVNPHENGVDLYSDNPPMAPDRVTKAASIVLFNAVKMVGGRTLKNIVRHSNQYFGITSMESPGYTFNQISNRSNGIMNMTVTYNRNSTVPAWNYYKGCREKQKARLTPKNYSIRKSKGALAYISNCFSAQYDRIGLIEAISKDIDVHVYGKCGRNDTCKERKDAEACYFKRHSQYYFYLSFENSLCQDYITEKFWDRLVDPSNMVPVAMGGISLKEYTDVAPENSFIHVYNFTSVRSLSKYLRYLKRIPQKYNAYHRWRETWQIHKNPIFAPHQLPACELCKIANQMPYMPADKNLSLKYNDPRQCIDYVKFPSKLKKLDKLDKFPLAFKMYP